MLDLGVNLALINHSINGMSLQAFECVCASVLGYLKCRELHNNDITCIFYPSVCTSFESVFPVLPDCVFLLHRKYTLPNPNSIKIDIF